jgi:hypothetical protein
MMRSRSLLLLVGPLAIAASLSAPAEACWLFGGGCGWGAGRAAYRPVYGYGRTSFYAPYSSYGYGGYAYGLGGCNSCSGGACGSYYGGYGMSSCCDTCGGPCGYGGSCSNCAGGDCQLGAPAGPVTPDPSAAQPQAPYSDMGTQSGESHPTTRNPPPDSDLGPRTIPEDDPDRATPGTTTPRPSFRPATPPAEGNTPVTPPENNNPTPPANDTESTRGEPASGASKDGAGFLDELDPDTKLRAPVIKVDLDDKVAWKPSATRTRLGTRPSYQTARLVRIAAYPAPAAWVPTLAEIAKK